ncbi:hypothetical protein Q1695_015333 [Nippostrongylus brasiliensis]|nr:hypothetical protein Q1695_015333 [Nippostrongylus brasiliensis]
MASAAGLLLLAATSVVVWTATPTGQDPQPEATLVPLEAHTDTLVYVHAVWRHGDRTPAVAVPFSSESAWPEGLGELTRKGMAQQYRLGKWLRARYGKWLGNRFDRNEIFVRSSDFNRTLMSAQVNMAGFFPPSKSELWDNALAWQPIPVHTVPKSIDKELCESIECPTASEELSRLWRSDLVRKMEDENKDIVEYLKLHSGIPNFEFRKLWMVYDNLFCMLQHNDTQKWPPWVNSTIFERIHVLYDKSSRLKYHTDLLRRLRGGPVLKDIIERFEAKANGTLGTRPKLYAYSAHDTTLAASLAAIGIYPEEFPHYASVVLFELHKKGGQFVVEIYHKNVTDADQLYRYKIAGCGESCPLQSFRSVTSRYLPDNWKEECGFEDTSAKKYIISTFVFAFTTLLLTGVLILDVMLKRKRRSIRVVNHPLMADEEEA